MWMTPGSVRAYRGTVQCVRSPSHRRPKRTDHRALAEGIYRHDELRSQRWTPEALEYAAEVGDLERPQRGVYTRGALPRARWERERAALLRTAIAASLMCERAVITHHASAILRALPVVGIPDRPCLTVQSRTALRSLAHVHLHRATLEDDDIEIVDGRRASQLSRTVMDLAREFGVGTGVVTADAALRAGMSPEALAASWEQCSNWPGRKAARMTLRLSDGLAESPLESLSRLHMVRLGVPVPVLQPSLLTPTGRFLGRPDFYWDEYGVIGEADGDGKYADRDEIVRERRRQQNLESAGLVVVRWGWQDLRLFEVVARRLSTAFRRGLPRGSAARSWVCTQQPP